MPVDIELDDNELYFCRIVAAMRNDPKEDARLKSSRLWGDHSSTYDVHVMGMCGEYAVAKYYGIMPHLFISMSGDGGAADLQVHGRSVQIKTRDRPGRDYALSSANPRDFKADIGALVYKVNDKLYRIQGVISKAKFLKVAKLKDFGYGQRLVAEAFAFTDPSVLVKPEPIKELPVQNGLFERIVSAIDR